MVGYIGATPQIGGYHKLDQITTNGSASYTMQLNSGNFVPESANHLIVSVNGVIQAPTDSFTVSGSTITFASSLSASDTIDFIMALGNTLDIGTPSDGTISASKLATTSITGQTAETSANDSDILLIYDDSATALRKMTRANFLSGVGGDNTPSFKAQVSSNLGPFSANTWTDISFNTEQYDTDNAFNGTTYTIPETGKYFFAVQLRFQNVPVDRQVQVKIDGASQNAIASQGTESADTTVSIQALGFSVLLDHNQGNNLKVQIFINGSNSMTVHTESWFCGFKLLGV